MAGDRNAAEPAEDLLLPTRRSVLRSAGLVIAASVLPAEIAWCRDRDHIEKGFVYGGMPARSGVTSALLAQGYFLGGGELLFGGTTCTS